MARSTLIAKEQGDILTQSHQFARTLSLHIHTHLLRFAQFIVYSEGILFLLSWGEIEYYLHFRVSLDKRIQHLHHSVLIPHLISQFRSHVSQHHGFVGTDALLLQIILIHPSLLVSYA